MQKGNQRFTATSSYAAWVWVGYQITSAAAARQHQLPLDDVTRACVTQICTGRVAQQTVGQGSSSSSSSSNR
jgi:hypothetical protein